MPQPPSAQGISLPDHGQTLLDAPPADSSGAGALPAEVELLLAEFNAASLPPSPGGELRALRRRFVAARGDNFVLREHLAALQQQLAALGQELAVCRHQLAVLEWDRNAHKQFGLELRHQLDLAEGELRSIGSSTSWRAIGALRRFVGRARGWFGKVWPRRRS